MTLGGMKLLLNVNKKLKQYDPLPVIGYMTVMKKRRMPKEAEQGASRISMCATSLR